ncbi:MAG TPA: hypothetical protein VFR11_21460 [Micromonosporaceae bacterium]|nr:hypothetical protein [Micromonosporaceae bacterium]
MDSREADEFRRIELSTRLVRDREVVAQYEAGLEFYRRRVEDTQYDLGRLDERLGGERR